MPNDVSLEGPESLALDEVHIGYLAIAPLDRLMKLRNALVALKGPLASEPTVQENLRRHVFNQEAENRVLGKHGTSIPCEG